MIEMKKYNESFFTRVAAMNMAEEGGKIWMVLLNRNGICEVDKKTGQARICKVFKDESLAKKCLYCNVEKVGDSLVFSPWEAQSIAIYNLKSDSITYIPVKKAEQNLKEIIGVAKFWNMIPYHSYIYLLGYGYPSIVKINMVSMEVAYISGWVKDINRDAEMDTEGYFTDGYHIHGDWALIPMGCMNAVLELNLKTNDINLKRLDVSTKGIGGLSSADGDNIWMVGRGRKSNRIFCWNRLTDYIKEFYLEDVDENITDPFYAPKCVYNKVFLMPFSGNSVYEIDIKTNVIRKNENLVSFTEKIKAPLWPWWKTLAPRVQNGWLIFLTCSDLKVNGR